MHTAPTSLSWRRRSPRRGAAPHSQGPPQRYVARALANEYVEIPESCADGIDEIIETAVIIEEDVREERTLWKFLSTVKADPNLLCNRESLTSNPNDLVLLFEPTRDK